MASTSEIKNGLCIKHNNKLMQIIEFQHVKPGKGPAFVRTKMKGIEDGRVLDHTFPSCIWSHSFLFFTILYSFNSS